MNSLLQDKVETEKFLLECISKQHNQEIDVEFCKWFMFIQSDENNKFPINIDKLVELKIYDRKDNAKKKLTNYFVEDTDYKVILIAPILTGAIKNSPLTSQNKTVVKKRGGQNKEEILITVDCFKSLCMLPNNTMGKKVREYYLFVERVLKSLIERSFKELEIQTNLLKLEGDILKKQKNRLLQKKTYHKFKKGKVFYIVSDGDQQLCSKDCNRKYRYKVGIDNKDINIRLRQYRTSIPHTRLEFLMYTSDNSLIERCVLTKFKNNLSPHLNHEWLYLSSKNIISFILGITKMLDIEHTIENVDEYNKIFEDSESFQREYTNIIFVD